MPTARSSWLLLLALAGGCSEDQPGAPPVGEEHQLVLKEVKSALAEGNHELAWRWLSTVNPQEESEFAGEIETLRGEVKKKHLAQLLGRALKLRDAGKLDEALGFAARALQVDPGSRVAAGIQEQIEERIAARKPPAPVEPSTDDQRKSGIQALVGKGKELARKKSFEQAVAVFERVLRLDPKNCEALLMLGVVHAQTGKLKVATRHYRGFVEACPRHVKTPRIRNVLESFEKMQAR